MNICPFTKQPCNKPKVLHISEVTQLGVISVDVCGECSMKQQSIGETDSALDLLGYALSKAMLNQYFARYEKRCLGCGLNLDTFYQKGRLGCAQCYPFFKNELIQILPRYQAGTSHVGKKISEKKWVLDVADLQDQIRMLDLKLQAAVKKEDYEIAAVLKKKIDELKALITTTLSGHKTPTSSDQ